MTHITNLRAEHLPALHALYCAQTEALPHCLMPSAERFAADLRRPDLGSLFVAERTDEACGFAALRTVIDDEDREEPAITALFCTDAAAGAALIAACLEQAQSERVPAFPQSGGNAPIQGYNTGWDGLSERMDLQARLLSGHGFIPTYRELLLTCTLTPNMPPPPSAGVTFESGAGAQGGYRQRAWIGQERVGLCLYDTVGHLSDDPRAAQTGLIGWVWTDERFRRRGIASTLVHRALAQLRGLGCRTCRLGTGADNQPAQALYRALGFTVVDTAVSFVRSAVS